MSIHHNVLKIVAGVLLISSLPASAQGLRGGLGGGAGGMLGGSLAGPSVNGMASSAGNAGFGATSTFGGMRDRTQQTGAEARGATSNAVDTTHSRVRSARNATAATAHGAEAAGANTSRHGAAAAADADSAAVVQRGPAKSPTPSDHGLSLDGSGSTAAEQHAMGRNVSAQGTAGSQTSADRAGASSNADGQAAVAASKDRPATAEPTPSK